MLDKLQAIKRRWEDVEQQISDPKIISDMKMFKKLNKEYKDLTDIVNAYHIYKNVVENVSYNKEVLANEKDEELKDMAKMDLVGLEQKKEQIESEIRNMLVPKDPEDSKNAVIEIRAGTGGDEASIFAGDLYRMYTKYCETIGFKTELIDFSNGTAGGYKEVIFNVSGENTFGRLKFESGVHRVQRVPQTETMGRVHTSAASVIVMPEADEWDIELKDNDIRKDTFCSSGPGGQSVNTTKSAIRLTHIPTGLVVQCQDEKSQLKNLSKAMGVLRSRLYEIEFNKRMEEASKKRKTMVQTGDRSEKIRTYNYPQSRVTEHRIGLSMHNLTAFMNGDIGEFIDALQLAENAERLKEGGVLA